jgi:hypothetical protein
MTDGLYLPVVVNAVPTATVVSTNTTCGVNNGSITISNPLGGDTPNYTYSIDGINYQVSGSFTSLAPGTYTVYIHTPGDNCIKTYTKVITASTELVATISPSVTICPGDSPTLTASGGTGYTWYDGATNIGTTASITVTPTATSQYSCVVTDGTCQATVYTYVTVDVCGGIDELSSQVNIYPNPTNGLFTIEVPGDFNYKLYDARGRLIANGEANELVDLSIKSYESGIYFIDISTDKFENTFKIVKK